MPTANPSLARKETIMTMKKTSPIQPASAKNKTAKTETQQTRKQAKKETDLKKLSALAAAVKVLGENDQPMSSGEMIEAMATKGYWSSPKGRTPASTLYAAILREITVKGKQARFQKTERGKFALNPVR
jgi:hypothetical protein